MGLFTKPLKLDVGGMSCEHCEKAIVTGVMELAGVKSVKADFKKGAVTVSGGEAEAVKAKIAELGYAVR